MSIVSQRESGLILAIRRGYLLPRKVGGSGTDPEPLGRLGESACFIGGFWKETARAPATDGCEADLCGPGVVSNFWVSALSLV